MSAPDDLERRRHHRQPRVTQHWSATDPNRTHPGPVAGCELCQPRTCGPCERGQHGCCDRGPYMPCECCHQKEARDEA